MSPPQLKYAKTHEWVALGQEGGAQVATLGITAFALEALTDLVHIELPKVGQTLRPGQTFGEVESVKAVSDLYSPVHGEVVAVHAEVADALDRMKSDPYEFGWLVKVRLADQAGLGELLDAAAYDRQCAEEAH